MILVLTHISAVPDDPGSVDYMPDLKLKFLRGAGEMTRAKINGLCINETGIIPQIFLTTDEDASSEEKLYTEGTIECI